MGVANVIKTKVCFRTYELLKQSFYYFQNVDFFNLTMNFVKKTI